MKPAHIRKIIERTERVLGLLLPWDTSRGEVEDPKKRLRQMIVRIDGERSDDLAADVWAVTELLETDIPELIAALRKSQQEVTALRRELAGTAGNSYQVTITSDAPIKVREVETVRSEQEPTE